MTDMIQNHPLDISNISFENDQLTIIRLLFNALKNQQFLGSALEFKDTCSKPLDDR